MTNPLGQRLYLRIWLAVVGAVALLTLLTGWLWRLAQEANAPAPSTQPREVIVRDEAGRTIGSAEARRVPGLGLEFTVRTDDGRVLNLLLPPRPRPPGSPPPGSPPGSVLLRPPFGYLWVLALVAVAVAIGAYPIVRRLTKRLEALHTGVRRLGAGELRTRVDESGNDEVAFLARQFNRSAERIEALITSHKSLLANASHELRSPLTRIRMGIELMGDSPTPAQRTEINRSIAELDQLIDEILLASRLDQADTGLDDTELVDLTGIAAEECARVDATLEAQMLELRGNARLLRRLVRNLLENARRYSGPHGSIELAVALVPGTRTARVVVSDDGPGVPEPERERIFEPFYRVHGASERDGGVGLGLSLVRTIAQRHGGTVRCEPPLPGSPYTGARFVVDLPVDAG